LRRTRLHRRCEKLSPTLPKPKTTIHDFYGFPRALYDVQYPAPGAPVEAKRLAFEQHLLAAHERGFVHGTWSILRHIYPDADVPVFQVSLDHGRTFAEHVVLAQELRGLRDRGVLIIGSGNLVHNLNQMNWSMEHCGYPWATEFDANVKQAIDQRDIASLQAPDRWGTSLLASAHPTLEHYAPILYTMGCTDERDTVSYPYEGMELGSVSMRMALFQPELSLE
jgi:4,5-DOPA dioxygenase extradiol